MPITRTDAEHAALCDSLNLFNAHEVSNTIIAQLELALPDGVDLALDINGCICINSAAIPTITACIQDTIACLIATLIDAGSERDAVNEADDLHDALTTELNSWSSNTVINEALASIDDSILRGAPS